MYSPKQKRQRQIISHYLELLYPKNYPDEQIDAVISRINKCTCYRQLLELFLSPEFVKDDRLYAAFYQKLQELKPSSRLLSYKVEAVRTPLRSWQRACYIQRIKYLLPYPVRNPYLSRELFTSIQQCNTREALAAFVHTIVLTKEAEIDAIEKRYKQLVSG